MIDPRVCNHAGETIRPLTNSGALIISNGKIVTYCLDCEEYFEGYSFRGRR